MPVDGSGGSAAIPVRMDGEPEPDLVVPVLPRHSRVAERVLHRNLSDAAARAYWLPLALFCGVVSQFIPMLGTYIGGALPVLFAWGSCGLWQAVAVLVFICVYQQIENLIFAPKISQRTMDVNDAVAFLAVLAFTSLFGALGAFLALPVVASVQTIFRTYTKRYELVDSPLMDDPVPEKKSKLVEGAEVLSEHLHNMPRAVQGSSAHVLFPTKCGSCRSRRTISPVPRNRWNRTKPSPFRSTC